MWKKFVLVIEYVFNIHTTILFPYFIVYHIIIYFNIEIEPQHLIKYFIFLYSYTIFIVALTVYNI